MKKKESKKKKVLKTLYNIMLTILTIIVETLGTVPKCQEETLKTGNQKRIYTIQTEAKLNSVRILRGVPEI